MHRVVVAVTADIDIIVMVAAEIQNLCPRVKPTNDTTTLKNNDVTGYGAADVEQNMVAQLLQKDQRRQVERMNRLTIVIRTMGLNSNPYPG